MLGTSALRVLGAGAGTGKLTAEIVRHGHEAIALDPGPAMLDALHNTLAVVETHVGAAEATGLPSACVGADDGRWSSRDGEAAQLLHCGNPRPQGAP